MYDIFGIFYIQYLDLIFFFGFGSRVTFFRLVCIYSAFFLLPSAWRHAVCSGVGGFVAFAGLKVYTGRSGLSFLCLLCRWTLARPVKMPAV